jgi:diguanylate cyclase (GGDEF)-like protein
MQLKKMRIKNTLASSKQRLMLLFALMISAGFLVTTFLSYFSSVGSIKKSIIVNELPLTSDNVLSAVQRDLIEPTLVSSMIANDTFLHNWASSGEKDIHEITRYLSQIKQRYQATTSFFISDRTHNYYYADGLLKRVSPSDAHDHWYFDLAKSPKVYETVVDTDQAHQNNLTIFINYKVFDNNQTFLGVGGMGLTVHRVSRLIDDYQERFERTIYFVDALGKIVLTGNEISKTTGSIYQIEGLKQQAKEILANKKESYEYSHDGHNLLLNVRYLPELHWYVFVEKNIDHATSDIRHSLYINLSICAVSTLLILFLMRLVLNDYHDKVNEVAVSDNLTGLANRVYLELMAPVAIKEAKRKSTPLSLLMMDLDHFKQVNDLYGHLAGDEVLRKLSATMQSCLRESDFICRWGGEEFLVLSKECDLQQAMQMAERIRLAVQLMIVDLGAKPVTFTISIGVTEWKPDEKLDALVLRADGALFQAKKNGRNRITSA